MEERPAADRSATAVVPDVPTQSGPADATALRAEAERLAADPADRTEARHVLADLEPLRGW